MILNNNMQFYGDNFIAFLYKQLKIPERVRCNGVILLQ